MRNLKDILTELEIHVDSDPMVIEQINAFVQSSWSKYLEKEKLRRNSTALQAIHFMLYKFGAIKRNDIPYLVDAVKFAYPAGYPRNACEADYIFLDKFVTALKENGFSSEDFWIKGVKDFAGNIEVLFAQYEDRQTRKLATRLTKQLADNNTPTSSGE